MPTYTCLGILSVGNLPRPAPDSCALPFSDMARTRVNISLGVNLFHIYNSQPNSWFPICVCPTSQPLWRSITPLTSRKLAPSVLCPPAPLSNRLVTPSGHRRPPARRHLSPGGHPASLLWCLSLSLRARYQYRSVLHHHLQDGFSGGHFSLLSVFFNLHDCSSVRQKVVPCSWPQPSSPSPGSGL